MFEAKKLSNTQKEQKQTHSSKDYVRTSDPKKLELIDLVIHQKYSMKLASQIVGVKLSTVKYIVKAYKTDKQEFMSKLKPKKDKLPKQRECDIPETESSQKKVILPQVKKQEPQTIKEQNLDREETRVNQQENPLIQLQKNLEFQLLASQFQLWNQVYGWNNNWFFGSYSG